MDESVCHLEQQLLKLLDQVLELLAQVCKKEDTVNRILEDYKNVSHLTNIIQELVRVAGEEFKRIREDNDRLTVKLEQSIKHFRVERTEHIRLEKELKSYIESLQSQTPAALRSHTRASKSQQHVTSPPRPAPTTSTVPSAILEKQPQRV